ncbi:MAG: hypothetical protein C5B54_10470 [Acidobacteria bacterium]|nr:MAG: hypothetical protein C5B54_10470 [Acidobacteriota bacterium]
MNTKQWKDYGYQILIDSGFVYLYRPGADVGYMIPEQGGDWVKYRNLNCKPWKFISYSAHPELKDKFLLPTAA